MVTGVKIVQPVSRQSLGRSFDKMVRIHKKESIEPPWLCNERIMTGRELVARIEKLLGAKVERIHLVKGGYTPALRLQCHTATASFFIKVGATPLTNRFLQREIQMYKRLHGEFLPKLVAWEEQEWEPILIIEDLSNYYWPPVLATSLIRQGNSPVRDWKLWNSRGEGLQGMKRIEFSGFVDGKPIRTVRDALLNALMRTFFIEIDTVFGNQALQMSAKSGASRTPIPIHVEQ